MKEISNKKTVLEAIIEDIVDQELVAMIEEDCTPINEKEWYDKILDETYSFECVGAPFASMLANHVLFMVAPDAYRINQREELDWALQEGNLILIRDCYYQFEDIQGEIESWTDAICEVIEDNHIPDNIEYDSEALKDDVKCEIEHVLNNYPGGHDL